MSYLEMVEDRNGALWLGTDSSGLHRFDPATGQFTKYEHDIDRPGPLSDNRVNSVYFDRSGSTRRRIYSPSTHGGTACLEMQWGASSKMITAIFG